MRSPAVERLEVAGLRRWTPALLAALAAVAAVAAAIVLPGRAAAQDYRGVLEASSRLVELRPLVRDTISRDLITVDEDGRLVYQGHAVDCLSTGRCTYLRSGDVRTAVAMTQDLRFTSWGFGVRGLSATVQLRSRQDLGEEFTWPRSDDPFDVLVAYAELVRQDFRVRAGRQRTRSGLGFSSFDGVSLTAYPLDGLSAEVYGGRSLARGLSEPRHDVLRGVESFLPDRNAYLLGASVRARPTGGSRMVARYQREIWSDRSALVSERASLDVRSTDLAPLLLEGSMDWDFAFGRVGKARVSARLPLSDGRLQLEVAGRRYLPYFELWTIWGLFSPVAYHQGEARATWSPSRRLGLRLGGGYRSYEDAHTDPLLAPTVDDAWFLDAGARYRAGGAWTLDGSYRIESGAGAFRSSGEVHARWREIEGLILGLHGMASQQIEEFRFGEAMVAGGGATAGIGLADDLTLDTGVSVYRQFFDNRPSGVDWSQLRAWMTLRLDVGGDPGLEREEER